MRRFTALNKLNPSAKVVDDRLIPPWVPPLGRKIVFTTGHHDPEAAAKSQLLHLRHPFLLVLSQMDIAFKLCQRNPHTELGFKKLNIPVQEVVRSGVRLMNQRILHLDDANARLEFLNGREKRIILPKVRRGSANVGLIFARIRTV